jgi:hypothetical protein
MTRLHERLEERRRVIQCLALLDRGMKTFDAGSEDDDLWTNDTTAETRKRYEARVLRLDAIIRRDLREIEDRREERQDEEVVDRLWALRRRARRTLH